METALKERRNLDAGPAGDACGSDVIRSSLAYLPRMADAIRQFVADLSDEVRRLEDCGRRGDTVGLRRTVHQLRGACGGYGFDSVSVLAERVEGSFDGKAGSPPVAEGVRDLIAMIRRIEGFGTT